MLYLIGTPIGNLEDLSPRAAKILLQCPIILTEDTRSFTQLIARAEEMLHVKRSADQHVWSYHKNNEFIKLPNVLHELENDVDIALVSEAGMPVISDPGQLLVAAVRRRTIPYTVVPGPSALDTALVASGMKFDHALFLGFLPKKESELQKLCSRLTSIHTTLPETVFVAYESPERIEKTCKMLLETYPQISLTLCRELTKKFEEIVQVTPTFDWSTVKGEMVLVFNFPKIQPHR